MVITVIDCRDQMTAVVAAVQGGGRAEEGRRKKCEGGDRVQGVSHFRMKNKNN